MTSFGSKCGNVLYLVVCAAPPALHAGDFVKLMQRQGWDVAVIATPSALDWLNADQLTQLSGHPLRSTFRDPGDPEFEPRGDAVLVVPATFNTINKWAAGISDTVVLGLLNEALGRSVPIVAVPWVNSALQAHPAYPASIATLQRAGVFISQPAGDDTDELAQRVAPLLRQRVG